MAQLRERGRVLGGHRVLTLVVSEAAVIPFAREILNEMADVSLVDEMSERVGVRVWSYCV